MDPHFDRNLKPRPPASIPIAIALAFIGMVSPASAMHISEGILPPMWAGLWFVVLVPFMAWGLRDLRRKSEREPFFKPMAGLFGAAVFIISCMPVPVPTAGTCSHPAGTGIAAVFVGPVMTVVISNVSLLLQALFLSHGGLTTLGANTVSMGVAGAFGGWFAFRIARRMGAPGWVAAFAAGVVGDWATYAVTAFALASALHGEASLWKLYAAIGSAFLPTQLPLGILEGVIAAGVYRFIAARRPSLLVCLGVEGPSCPKEKGGEP